jgi:uncharacterized protein (TIGR03437 family)
LDERRGQLYIANFSAATIEVMDTANRTLSTNPIRVTYPPSAIAISPDNRYLVVGYFNNFGTATTKGGYLVIDLDGGGRQESLFASPVLAVAFGNGSRALVVTTTDVLLLDPASAIAAPLATTVLGGSGLPVPFATFPPNIVEASAGVSGDGNTIVVLAATGPPAAAPSEGSGTVIFTYKVGERTATAIQLTTQPPLGPRVVSVNRDGSSFLAGWALTNSQGIDLAQFPYTQGRFRAGGHAFDFVRNQIYADVPVTAGESPVMHIVDTDNLTVRERIQLPQMMSGRSVFSSDMRTLYAGSDSGVTVLPVGTLATAPRVAALQEDLLFQGDACNRTGLSQNLDIVDLGGGNVDFTLSLPPNTPGIRLSQDSGTTPARVRVDIDPTPFQNTKGTTTVMLNLTSSRGINIPFPVRLLINMRDFNQQGRSINVPGKIVDILADRLRNRVYLTRQDRNQVLVYDTASLRQIATLRTGNTPMGMAITEDERYLIVGNDNSQFASVFDLDSLEPSEPIQFPSAYPRMIAVAHGAVWATAREVPPSNQRLFKIDFSSRMANAPASLGIFQNTLILPTAALAASPSLNSILLALPDGTVALWDSGANQWIASRKDIGTVSGAFGALTDKLFLVDNNLLNESLFPVATLTSQGGTSSGAAFATGAGIRTNASSPAGPGVLERIDVSALAGFHGTETIEAPMVSASLQSTPPVGQIGQTILPFTRTLAVPPDQGSVLMLTQSGFTAVPSDFDAPKPFPVVSAIVNRADGGDGVASGGLVEILGSGLSTASASAGSTPLPFALSNVCVELNSKAIPLLNLSSSSITAQLPFDFTGKGNIVVSNAGGKSSPFSVNILQVAPAIFRSGTAGPQTGIPLVVRNSNNAMVSLSNPIHVNDTIVIYTTGLGRTLPEPDLGAASPANPAATATFRPTVTLGGVDLDVQFAGLVPGQVGVYQINVFVPGNVREGVQTPLKITQGEQSTTLDVRVVNP